MIARTSPIVRLSVRAITPIALLIAAFVLFAGHNQPGGGFAAGLLLGAVIVLRTVAGLTSMPGWAASCNTDPGGLAPTIKNCASLTSSLICGKTSSTNQVTASTFAQ